MGPTDKNAVMEVHARLFVADVKDLKKIADKTGISWQIELRQLVRRALRGETRDVIVFKDQE